MDIEEESDQQNSILEADFEEADEDTDLWDKFEKVHSNSKSDADVWGQFEHDDIENIKNYSEDKDELIENFDEVGIYKNFENPPHSIGSPIIELKPQANALPLVSNYTSDDFGILLIFYYLIFRR